jgi:TIR domain
MREPKGEHERLKVFVSYSRADLEFADQLVKGLDLCGFEPTIDRTELWSGEAFRQRLTRLIREAVLRSGGAQCAHVSCPRHSL